MLQRIKQWVDWNAVLWAGAISGLLFFVLNSLLSAALLDNPWLFARMSAGLLLGESALAPAAEGLGSVLLGLVVHLVLSLLFAALIAFAIHRWGILVGIFGGAVLGLALYWINTYSLSYFFPWFYALRSWLMLVSHIVFGALAGGIYELLEDEAYDERYESSGQLQQEGN